MGGRVSNFGCGLCPCCAVSFFKSFCADTTWNAIKEAEVSKKKNAQEKQRKAEAGEWEAKYEAKIAAKAVALEEVRRKTPTAAVTLAAICC